MVCSIVGAIQRVAVRRKNDHFAVICRVVQIASDLRFSLLAADGGVGKGITLGDLR